VFAALEDSDTEVEINSAWQTIRENRKISTKERLGYFEAMVRLRMLKIIRSEETSSIVVVTESR
jgi:hypothetical protein